MSKIQFKGYKTAEIGDLDEYLHEYDEIAPSIVWARDRDLPTDKVSANQLRADLHMVVDSLLEIRHAMFQILDGGQFGDTYGQLAETFDCIDVYPAERILGKYQINERFDIRYPMALLYDMFLFRVEAPDYHEENIGYVEYALIKKAIVEAFHHFLFIDPRDIGMLGDVNFHQAGSILLNYSEANLKILERINTELPVDCIDETELN